MMGSILAFFMLTFASIAMADGKPTGKIEIKTVEAKTEAMKAEVAKVDGASAVKVYGPEMSLEADGPKISNAALPDCIQQVVDGGLSPQTLIALYPMILVLLRLLAEGLGKLGAKGNAAAGSAAKSVAYLINILGWLIGKMGWGAVRGETIKTMPKFKITKAA